VAKENKTTLPSAAMFIIRYHSFYGKVQLRSKKFPSLKINTIKFITNIKWFTILFYTILFIYFAALHREGAYKHLMNDEDVENLKWLHIFK
jgi:inositol oxygenase